MTESKRVTEELLADFIKNNVVSDDDPAILILWNQIEVAQFAEYASTPQAHQRPQFLPQVGAISGQQLIHCFMDALRPLSGGIHLDTIIGPNNLDQYTRVIATMMVIFMDPFMQDCMRLMPPDRVLGQVYRITDKTMARGKPCTMAALPVGMRNLFE